MRTKTILKNKFLSLLIDYVFIIVTLFLIAITLTFILSFGSGMVEVLKNIRVEIETLDKIHKNVGSFIGIIFLFFYYSHAFKKSGQTIGEKIMKIKIIPAYGKRISLLSGILRTIFLAPLLAIIGLIPVSRNPYKSLLDHISLTKTEKV